MAISLSMPPCVWNVTMPITHHLDNIAYALWQPGGVVVEGRNSGQLEAELCIFPTEDAHHSGSIEK